MATIADKVLGSVGTLDVKGSVPVCKELTDQEEIDACVKTHSTGTEPDKSLSLLSRVACGENQNALEPQFLSL